MRTWLSDFYQCQSLPISATIGSLLFLHFNQDKPAVIPATDTSRICHNEGFCFIHTFRAEWYGLCQTTQLIQQVVGVDVVRPCAGHRFCHLRGVQVGEDLLYPTEFCDGVDFVRSERADQLIFVVLDNFVSPARPI